MKIRMTAIDMICSFAADGIPTPIRWRIPDKPPVHVDRIAERRQEKIAGIPTLIYRCQSIIGDREWVYELKFEIPTHRWYLYKI